MRVCMRVCMMLGRITVPKVMVLYMLYIKYLSYILSPATRFLGPRQKGIVFPNQINRDVIETG